MVKIKLAKPKLKKVLRPGLLKSSGIPLPLSQVNPRNIKGPVWWKEQRRKVIAANNNHCWACGVHQQDARYKQYLEAHEVFTVNYAKRISTFKEVVALCHCCHNVVHVKRLVYLAAQGKEDEKKLRTIVQHGVDVLQASRLALPYQLEYAWMVVFGGCDAQEAIDKLKASGLFNSNMRIAPHDWHKWRMEFEGQLYKPKFNSEFELARHYYDAD